MYVYVSVNQKDISLNLHPYNAAAKGFQSKNGRTTYTSTGPNLTPEIYRTVGTDHDCTHPGNRGTIWVQRCQLVSLGANQNQGESLSLLTDQSNHCISLTGQYNCSRDRPLRASSERVTTTFPCLFATSRTS